MLVDLNKKATRKKKLNQKITRQNHDEGRENFIVRHCRNRIGVITSKRCNLPADFSMFLNPYYLHSTFMELKSFLCSPACTSSSNYCATLMIELLIRTVKKIGVN